MHSRGVGRCRAAIPSDCSERRSTETPLSLKVVATASANFWGSRHCRVMPDPALNLDHIQSRHRKSMIRGMITRTMALEYSGGLEPAAAEEVGTSGEAGT